MRSKKINIILIIIILSMSILLFFSKDKLSCFITNYKLNHLEITITKSDSTEFFNQFKNTDNSKTFELSLVSLGGKGCKPCMRMDSVLISLSKKYKNLKIKKYVVTQKEERKIAKYFNVTAIPTQIILDKNAEEIFRHTGFISKKELSLIIDKNIAK